MLEGATMKTDFVEGNGNVSIINNQDLLQKLNDEMTATLMPVTVFVGIEAVLGFFGNLLVLHVFMFHYQKCNFRYFVLCLSLIDFTCTITALPGQIVVFLNWYMFPSDVFCSVKTFFNMFTVNAEAFCLLTIAIDRYRKVCNPLGWQIKPSMAMWLCVADVLCGAFISLPVAIYTGTRKIEKTYMNKTIIATFCDEHEEYVNTEGIVIYHICLQTITCMCLFAMIILNVLLYRRILKSSLGTRWKPKADVSSTNQRNVADDMKDMSNKSETSKVSSLYVQENSSARTDSQTDQSTESTTTTNVSCEANTQTGSRNNAQKCVTNKTARARQKTKITLILTIIFISTTVLYLTLAHLKSKGILNKINDAQKATFLFFFRIVLINQVINPFVYGCLDANFKTVVRRYIGCSR